MLVKSIYHARRKMQNQIVNASINVQIKFQKKISKPSFRITGSQRDFIKRHVTKKRKIPKNNTTEFQEKNICQYRLSNETVQVCRTFILKRWALMKKQYRSH